MTHTNAKKNKLEEMKKALKQGYELYKTFDLFG
jgi:hypothetical protein